MRNAFFGAVTALAALGSLGAQDCCPQPCCQTLGEYIGEHSRFTIGGGYARRHIHEDRLLESFAPIVINFDLDPDVSDLPAGFLTRNKAEGNWGLGFVRYEFVAPKALYTALRGTWGGGKLHPHHDVQIPTQDLGQTEFDDDNVGIEFYNLRSFTNYAHEWNVEGRVGFAWLAGQTCCGMDWLLAPFLGAGYRGGHMNIIGRQRYHWLYIPVGFMGEWNFCDRWSLGLDAEVGLMANGRFNPDDAGRAGGAAKAFTANNLDPNGIIADPSIPFDNKYEWQIELPISYTAITCGYSLSFALVPFWEGWKTRERVVQEGFTTAVASLDPFPLVNKVSANSPAAGAAVPQQPTPTPLSSSFIISNPSPLSAPRIINSTIGFRIDISTHF